LENKDGFKDLIVAICASPLFRGELSQIEIANNSNPANTGTKRND